jgi:chromate transporter
VVDPTPLADLSPLLDLAKAWGRIGLLGFGGGPGMIPLMRAECVETHGWMSDAEFLEGLALGSALPGPISVKMAIFSGRQVAGWFGGLVALLAVVMPAAVAMVSLVGIYLRVRHAPVIVGAMTAVKPVVIGLLAWTVLLLAPDAVKGWPSALMVALTIGALYMEVHPALVVVAGLCIGAAFLR